MVYTLRRFAAIGLTSSVLRVSSCKHLPRTVYQTQSRSLSLREFFKMDANVFSVYYSKTYLLCGFLFAMVYVAVFAVQDVNNKKTELEKKNMSSTERRERDKMMDPRRPPWPMLHHKAVSMREGKLGHEDIGLLWNQTKYYYPHDWLIPLEIAQILKFSSGSYLSSYVPDPDGFRLEIIQQLDDVRSNRAVNSSEGKVSKDIFEIVSIAIDELESISLDANAPAPLVPIATKRTSSF